MPKVLQESAKEAANYAYEHHLSKPFQGYKDNPRSLHSRLRIQYSYNAAGTRIVRPNHGLAHIMRTAYYLPYILQYYKQNGVKNPDGQCAYGFDKVTDTEFQQLQIAIMFYVAGREDETGFAQDAKRYNFFRQRSSEAFRNYCLDKNLIGEGKVFASFDVVEQYATLLQQGEHNLITFENRGEKPPALAILLATAHELDLSRCYFEKKLRKALFNDKLNKYSQYPENRDMHALVLYSQSCIRATGDKLKVEYKAQDWHMPGDKAETRIRPLGPLKKVSVFQKFRSFSGLIRGNARHYNDAVFAKCSQSVDASLTALAEVPTPKFLGGSLSKVEATTSQVMEVVSKGNALIRLMNGEESGNSLRFEAEQYADTKKFRPIFWQKKSVASEKRRKHLLDLKTQRSQERKIIDEDTPAHGTKHEDYFDTEGNPKKPYPIRTFERRGGYKDTQYTKKMSFTLVPKKMKFTHFVASSPWAAIKNFFGITHKVGMILDADKMHKKGERYIWPSDAGTTGKRGYFWLDQKRRKNIDDVLGRFPDRYKPVRYKELQKKINAEQPKKSKLPYNEMLMGGSAKALSGLFIREESSLLHRMELINAYIRLKADYALSLPMFLIDGSKVFSPYYADKIRKNIRTLCGKFYKGNKIKQWFFRIFLPVQYSAINRIAKRLKINLHDPKQSIDAFADRIIAETKAPPLPPPCHEPRVQQASASCRYTPQAEKQMMRKVPKEPTKIISAYLAPPRANRRS